MNEDHFDEHNRVNRNHGNGVVLMMAMYHQRGQQRVSDVYTEPT